MNTKQLEQNNTMMKTTLNIEEYLDHAWHDELVSGKWTDKKTPVVRDEQEQVLVSQKTADKVWWKVDHLAPLGKRTFTIDAGSESTAASACAGARPVDGGIIISNSVIALLIPSPGAVDEGVTPPPPLLGIRRADDDIWKGSGTLKLSPDLVIDKITFETCTEGPLWCEYELSYHSGERCYSVRFRLEADIPEIEIHEKSNLGFDATWKFDLHPGFAPNKILYTTNNLPNGERHGETLFVPLRYDGLEHIGEIFPPDKNRHSFPDDFDIVGFINDDDYLGVCAISDASWSYVPDNRIGIKPSAQPSIELCGSCRAGDRQWVLVTGDAQEVRDGDFFATPAARARRRRETTLSKVMAMTLAWPEPPIGKRAPVVASADDLERARKLYASWTPLKQYAEHLDRSKPMPIGRYDSSQTSPPNTLFDEDPVCAWLAKPDAQTARLVKEGLLEGLRDRVSGLLGTRGHRADRVGTIDLGRMLRPFAMIRDLLGTALDLSPAEDKWMRAALAFLCYKAADKDCFIDDAVVLHADHPRSYHHIAWYPGRESDLINYNVDTMPHNFLTDLYTALGCAALTLVGHPMQDTWIDHCLGHTERMLAHWVFPTGAYIESMTYTFAELTHSVPYFIMLKRNGKRNFLIDERFQRICNQLTRMLLPVDRRFGLRSLPPLGDAMYPLFSISMLGYIASETIDDAPEFSARVNGLWQACGGYTRSPSSQGINFYDALFLRPDLPSQLPENLKSEHVEGLGLVMRHDFGKEEEVFCFFKAGEIYSHYHLDEGSFFLFADGVPLLDEYGSQYSTGENSSGEQLRVGSSSCHNGISFGEHPDDRDIYNRGRVDIWKNLPHADYAVMDIPVHLLHIASSNSTKNNWQWGFEGEEEPRGWWRRHVLFIKPFGFFFHDELTGTLSSTLDLNIKAKSYESLGDLSRVYRGIMDHRIAVHINQPLACQAEDDAFHVEPRRQIIAHKHSPLADLTEEDLTTFYDQMQWRISAPPETDFNWGLAWGRENDQTVLKSLPGAESKGFLLEHARGAVRAVISPRWKEATKIENPDFSYRGWAGALIGDPHGDCSMLQLVGDSIGVPGRLMILDNGPSETVLEGNNVKVHCSGQSRWITFCTPNPAKGFQVNGMPARTDTKVKGETRVFVPANQSEITFTI